ncbi:MAG: histidine phosphatase family protein [Oscillospiraceae bacterium]
MIIHLIRHGRTIANENHLYCGATDIPLTQLGKQELILLKSQINYPKSNLIIASGLLRTMQTANILFDNKKLEVIEDLQEINFGDFEMRGYKQLKSDLEYQRWISDIEVNLPPNGEGKPHFIKRVINGFKKAECLCKNKGEESAVIVTHGGVIAILMENFFPHQKNFYQWQPTFGRGYTLCFDNPDNINYKEI